MNFERKLCALLLQDPTSYLPRVKRVRLESSDLEDKPSQIIFDTIMEVSNMGEVTLDSVKSAIQTSDLNNSDKVLYSEIVSELVEACVEEVEYTFSFLAKHKEEQLLKRYLKQAATSLKTGGDVDHIKKQLSDSLSRLKLEDVNLKEYEDNFLTRETQRHTKKHGLGMVRLSDRFRHLRKYFAYGFSPGTINIIMGSTNAGKSVLLANFVEMAADSNNKLNVLYVFSENQEIEAMSRLDAVVLDKPYKKLYEEYLSRDEILQVKGRSKAGCGKIFYCKPEFENFSSVTIENALDAAIDKGYKIDAVFIDSPDHMRPLKSAGTYHIDKPQVWKDLKSTAEKYMITVFGTWPLREEYSGQSQKGKEPLRLQANSGAGGQDVARVADNIIAFSYDEAVDDLMKHRLFEVVKCRDGVKDFCRLRYMIQDTLKFISAEDYEASLPKGISEIFKAAAEPDRESD